MVPSPGLEKGFERAVQAVAKALGRRKRVAAPRPQGYTPSMKQKCGVEPEAAVMYLKDAEPLWRAFWFHMHLMAKNLREFGEGLGTISDEVFAYHVSGQKNDLSRWVGEVIGDATLADDLRTVKDQHQAAAMVRDRVAELEGVAGRRRA